MVTGSVPEAGATGNPSSPSLGLAAFPGPAGNPIPEAPGRGRSVHLPRACVCVEGPWPGGGKQVGGGGGAAAAGRVGGAG